MTGRGDQNRGYHVVKSGTKFKVHKLMGEYDTKREAVVAMLKFLREESELKEIADKRMKGISRYF